jgi:hypothetical protein
MSRGPDSGTLLGRALLAAAAAAGCPARLTGSDWSRWASATFTGARHTLTLEAPPSVQLDAWLAADIAVAEMERDNGRVMLCLEALTIEER